MFVFENFIEKMHFLYIIHFLIYQKNYFELYLEKKIVFELIIFAKEDICLQNDLVSVGG